MSSESHYAWRAARFYGPIRVQMSRLERIEFLREQITLLENLWLALCAAHKANCSECQNGDFCLDSISVTPEDRKRLDRLSFMRGLIRSEEQDEAYAQCARTHPIEYKQHIDGFCSYWQNVRHRKFESAGWKCERCKKQTSELDAHHLHYDTLGFEELCDLQALCRNCHEYADKVRAAGARYDSAMDTYMRKRYGDNYEWSERAEEEFDRWLEDKQEREEDYY